MGIKEYTDKNFFELTGNRISSVSQLKLFNILLDDDRVTKFMNIFRVARLNSDILKSVLFFDTYEASNDEFWDNISYRVYELPQLWWIIGLMNNVVNPFEELNDGDLLRILKEQYVYALTKDLEGIAE